MTLLRASSPLGFPSKHMCEVEWSSVSLSVPRKASLLLVGLVYHLDLQLMPVVFLNE